MVRADQGQIGVANPARSHLVKWIRAVPHTWCLEWFRQDLKGYNGLHNFPNCLSEMQWVISDMQGAVVHMGLLILDPLYSLSLWLRYFLVAWTLGFWPSSLCTISQPVHVYAKTKTFQAFLVSQTYSTNHGFYRTKSTVRQMWMCNGPIPISYPYEL